MLDVDHGLAVLVDNLERPVLAVLLDIGVLEVAADQTLGVEDSVGGVLGSLVLGGVTNEALVLGEADP